VISHRSGDAEGREGGSLLSVESHTNLLELWRKCLSCSLEAHLDGANTHLVWQHSLLTFILTDLLASWRGTPSLLCVLLLILHSVEVVFFSSLSLVSHSSIFILWREKEVICDSLSLSGASQSCLLWRRYGRGRRRRRGVEKAIWKMSEIVCLGGALLFSPVIYRWEVV